VLLNKVEDTCRTFLNSLLESGISISTVKLVTYLGPVGAGLVNILVLASHTLLARVLPIDVITWIKSNL